MIRLLNTVLSALVIYASLTAPTRAEEPAWPKRTLTFELSDEPQMWERLNPEVKGTPTHVAVIQFEGDARRIFRNLQAHQYVAKVKETEKANSLSDQQRAFLAVRGFNSAHVLFWENDRVGSKERHRVFLYAMSEQDAHTMAEALIEVLDAEAKANLEKAKQLLAHHREVKAQYPKTIAQLKEKLTQTRSAMKKLETYVIYSQLTWDAVRADKTSLDSKLRAIEIDMKGVQAKIDAIKKVQSQPSTRSEIARTLDRMLIEQDIEMAGLLARMQATEFYRGNAAKWLCLWRESKQTLNDINNKEAVLSRADKEVKRMEQILANPSSASAHGWQDRMYPVKIVDNKVVIHQVQVK